jgi:D-alanine transaminase
MIVYYNGEYMPKEEVKLSPDDRGFLFADGIYEVIRAYPGHLFAVEAHLQRMRYGLRELRIKPPQLDFRALAVKLLQDNHLDNSEALVYFQITRGAAPRLHTFPPDTVQPTIYAYASAFHPPQEKWDSGVKVILTPDIRWTRCDIKSISLLPNVLANQQAEENGAYEAVFVRNGLVTEGSRTNFCGVLEGQLVTHPKGPYILPGITRDVVLALCRDLSIPVREYPILEQELKKADELMLVGTTTEIMPVVQVNDWPVGNGQPGPVTRKLQQRFRERINDE